MASEVTAQRSHTPGGSRVTSGSHTFPEDFSVGSLVVVSVNKYTDLDPNDALTQSDLVKSAGTATISAWQMHATGKRNAGSIEVDTAVYSARVTGAGSLEVTASKATAAYWTIGGTELTGTWDDSRGEAGTNGDGTLDGPNVTSVSPAVADSAGGAVYVGSFALNSTGGTGTIGAPGNSFSEVFAEPNANLYTVAAMALRIVTVATDDLAAQWTLSSSLATNGGAAAAMAVLKEVGDPTAPVLTSPTGSATSSTTATIGATTDEANGTMYAVVDTVTTTPSAAEIEAGQDGDGGAATWSGSQAITTTGAKTFSVTGLAPNTSYSYFIGHKDAAGNFSNIVGGTFTTDQRAMPSADVIDGTWTPSAGADLFAVLDENPASDADYIQTNTAADSCTVALASLTDPASSAGHKVSYRLQGDGTSGVLVELLQGSTVIASWTHDPAPTSATQFDQTLTGTQADSITDYTALRVRFTEV